LLLKTNYELSEIWTPDEDKEVQVWSNKKLKKLINVTITDDNPIEDNTTKVVNELVDLWLELRAIRNALEDADEDYSYKTIKEPSAFEKYHSKVEELEEEWKDNENYLSKIFKENIDPSVLAYLHLDEDDKLLLTN
jgi:regulator of replication initiation timing